MKARDLAALAALGVAGYAAYDKFGRKKDEDKKDEAPKLRGKLGSSKSANDDTEGEYRGNMLGQGRSANEGDAGEAEARMSKRSRQENDVPDRIMGKDAAGSRFTDRVAAEESVAKKPDADARAGFARVKAAGANSKTPKAALAASTANDDADAAAKSLSSTGGPSRARFNAAQDSQNASSAAPASGRVGTQPAMDAYSRATRPAAGNQAMAAMDRATVPAQGNVGSGNAAMGAFSQVKAVPKNIKYATEAEKARQTLIDEKNYDSDLMKNRRQAVVDTVKNIPANVKNAFKPLTKQEIIDQKNYDSQLNRDRREAAFGSVKNLFGFKKGGAVKKMASGGMTSSKMSSKASTASSRGDGIAQRGKTRGQMR